MRFVRKFLPLHRRSPQQYSITGHAKDHRAKGITMSIIRYIRTLLFAFVLLAISAVAYAQISVSISFAPPELPVYEQPVLPGEGYIWTPGYWAYADDDGYYWVPGTWVMAPEPGLLWTPAYWGWGGNGYVFYDGYWGQQVGFYGGISYGYGYYGDGYQGGRWQNGQFYYNRSVNNVNVTNIHNVYNTTVINNTTINRVSYNGGSGGIIARPTPQQETVAHERHIPPVAAQTQHAQAARTNPEQRASLNHGTPAVAATPKPGAFSDSAVVHAKPTGTPYNAPVNRAAVQPPANIPVAHPENNPARSDRPAANNQPESNRAPSARSNQPEPNKPQPNSPEPNKPEPNRPPTTQPQRQPEPDRAPAAQPNNRPEPNRNEPTQRPLSPSASERSQPERTSPSEPKAQQQQQRPQSAPNKQEEKKPQEEKPKQNERPPQ